MAGLRVGPRGLATPTSSGAPTGPVPIRPGQVHAGLGVPPTLHSRPSHARHLGLGQGLAQGLRSSSNDTPEPDHLLTADHLRPLRTAQLVWPGYGYNASGTRPRVELCKELPIAPVSVSTFSWDTILADAQATLPDLFPNLLRAYQITHTTDAIDTTRPTVPLDGPDGGSLQGFYAQRHLPQQRQAEFLASGITAPIPIDQVRRVLPWSIVPKSCGTLSRMVQDAGHLSWPPEAYKTGTILCPPLHQHVWLLQQAAAALARPVLLEYDAASWFYQVPVGQELGQFFCLQASPGSPPQRMVCLSQGWGPSSCVGHTV